jgi:superfamily II DNA or RNA helicase/diadenosine tetraphosphate (Ap4A) HIT family hydrolase
VPSPFLDLPASAWVASNALAFAIRDKYPVSPGHTLVVPRREVAMWFEATPEEQAALFALVAEVRARLDAEAPKPDGYNIGINVGEAAGQTVHHLHVHVIPRYRGDMDDPRGGVRHVIPGRGNYLAAAGGSREPPRRAPPLTTGGPQDPFARHLWPLWAQATDVAIIAAFVQESGLWLLKNALFAALARQARVRLVTGDYLGITQAAAMEQLLDWTTLSNGAFEARVVETARLPDGSTSFHPKSWRFEGPGLGVAFVGSSNVSRSALSGGIEWNLRVDRGRDPEAWQRIVDAFASWWPRARALDREWVAEYARRAAAASYALPPGEDETALPQPPLEPHELQVAALEALALDREDGRKRACVVLGTGLGKTLLAALDARAFLEAVRDADTGRQPRVLVLAHREELLEQAGRTFRQVLRPFWPGLRLGWFVRDRNDLQGDVVLASVQKLARKEHLERLEPGAFDYVIVDEVHHAAADSYRKILNRLQPQFLLGLTATPERADGGDVLGLFDDHIVYRADLGVGVSRGLLVPFAYFGLKDEIDYANIPWRNQRFDPDVLAKAAETQARMETLWAAWQEHPGARTIVFCCSIHHADFARDWLRERGVKAEAIHTGPTSADREATLKDFDAGTVEAVCAVDLFNEGLDVPRIDRVVMLRPTESSVIFLQQLGRGLRKLDGKERLTVIDFVGNHRVFLDRVRTLLNLGEGKVSVRQWIDGKDADLPPGCSLDVEVEAKDLLAKLLPSGKSVVEEIYRELLAARDARPTVGELYRMGYRPSTLREEYGGWFDFCARIGGLSDPEKRVLAAAGDWLRELEITPMSKCFKMVVLEALLEADQLGRGMKLAELAPRCHELLIRSPELASDLDGVAELPDPKNPPPERWLAYWKSNPINAWTSVKKGAKTWFELDGDELRSKLPATPDDEATLAAMTQELVDYRLAQYRARGAGAETASPASFEAQVILKEHDPVFQLPGEHLRPRGLVDARLPDGSVWQFRFMKEECKAARPVGSQKNQLPDLLRRWFGVAAGSPGTAFAVRFSRSPDGWWVEPVGAQVIAFPPRGKFVAFPSLRVAAGNAGTAQASSLEADEVRLPAKATGPGLFAVRADGDSMDGGKKPIRDGDWLVMRYARGESVSAIDGRVALVQTADATDANAYQVKRVVRDGNGWTLRSDNPARRSFPATEATVPVALLVETIHPEALGPRPGTVIPEEQLAEAFGLQERPRTGRVEGHLFLLVDKPGIFVAPDRLKWPVSDRRPGETALVLVRQSATAAWTYLGVGRWIGDEGVWATPDLDFPAWRALGTGRSASRRLPAGMLDRAKQLVDDVFARNPAGSVIEARGMRLRVVGRADKGGLRIDGGPGGFEERTVSLGDIAWVLVARERFSGTLDEPAVNRVRYLDGTPKASTRWIDTKWAVLITDGPG